MVTKAHLRDQLLTDEQVEKLAKWMLDNSFATGHGDSFDDLLKELGWQVEELREKLRVAEGLLSDPRSSI